jgi:formylglycine-generating enzyme required for sulfatase activity
MKLLKLLPILVIACCMVGCGQPAGELVGAVKNSQFEEAHPYGMVFMRKGSFMMGSNSQSAVFTQDDNNVMVTVHAFWMDETEITNNEYRQFVNWVRDSIAYTLLMEEDEAYAIVNENQDDDMPARINWGKKIPWESRFDSEDPAAEALGQMFYDNGRGALRTTMLRYNYSWMNVDEVKKNSNRFDVTTGVYPKGAIARVDTFWVEEGAILSKTIERPLREPKDALTNAIICVYPDTMVWARDFQMSYNEPLLHGYFCMPGYAEYPVVGVTWEQANAFCHWRTNLLQNVGGQMTNAYRLPTEAEWEYAARGGRKMAMYPWGDKYARDSEGCFMANFKPYRGSYYDDKGASTMAVKQFYPNDFGLYDMAGNVAEWTASAYSSMANVNVHDMNPQYTYHARKEDPDILRRKVVKGGSWKDVSYYLQCGVRTYEYQFESRSYIGFRCVRSYIGN